MAQTASEMDFAPRLSAEQRRVLLALASGAVLKVHRTLDGEKTYQLHGDGGRKEIDPGTVERLAALGLVESNMKFPAATFLLSEAGADAAARLGGRLRPLTSRQYR